MVNGKRIIRIKLPRRRSFEEQEILGAKAPTITSEKFLIGEEFFVKGDLLPKSGKKLRDVVP